MGRFYESKPDVALRLGDVVQGFPVTVPNAVLGSGVDELNLNIRVIQPRFLVVMTPCCSIEGEAMTLAPLTKVRPAFFKNPYLAEDLTRINRNVKPKDSYPPEAWDKMSAETKAERLSQEPGYVFLDCFVFAQHDLLPVYTTKLGKWQTQTGYYMVDFKGLYRFESKQIQRDQAPPSGCKILQLSAVVRKDLREKLTYYFSRPAREDMAALQSQSV